MTFILGYCSLFRLDLLETIFIGCRKSQNILCNAVFQNGRYKKLVPLTTTLSVHIALEQTLKKIDVA
jgi:hypothetical protein